MVVSPQRAAFLTPGRTIAISLISWSYKPEELRRSSEFVADITISPTS
jgi:hypothetical protein